MQKILAVVVRYNTALVESETLRGLSSAFAENPGLLQAIEVLLWDNSAEPLDSIHLEFPVVYRHSAHNLGVSGAYNGAMKYAIANNHTWMLLLDQDSEVSETFLSTLIRHAESLHEVKEIAAILPTILCGESIASPREQLFGRSRAYPEHEVGVASGEAIGINSGCMMRTECLAEIGGFSLDFWLDYSDLYVFHQFFLKKKRVWLAADARMRHEMTVADYDRLMSPWRYRNFSYAETAFYDLYRSRIENMLHHLRLFVRTFRQKRRFKNPVFSEIAWEQFLYRLRVRRKKRLIAWHLAGAERTKWME